MSRGGKFHCVRGAASPYPRPHVAAGNLGQYQVWRVLCSAYTPLPMTMLNINQGHLGTDSH